MGTHIIKRSYKGVEVTVHFTEEVPPHGQNLWKSLLSSQFGNLIAHFAAVLGGLHDLMVRSSQVYVDTDNLDPLRDNLLHLEEYLVLTHGELLNDPLTSQQGQSLALDNDPSVVDLGSYLDFFKDLDVSDLD